MHGYKVIISVLDPGLGSMNIEQKIIHSRVACVLIGVLFGRCGHINK